MGMIGPPTEAFMDVMQDVELTESQAEMIGRALLAVARSDGEMDPREIALIEELSPTVTSAADPEPAEIAAALPSPEQRELLLRSALLVALVDRGFSDAERALLGRYAEALDVSPDRMTELTSSVKAFLLESLLPLANTDAVVEVSRKIPV